MKDDKTVSAPVPAKVYTPMPKEQLLREIRAKWSTIARKVIAGNNRTDNPLFQ